MRPFLDDKILTSGNGLAVAALASAGKILGNAEYIELARKTVGFFDKHMMTPDGGLYARYRDGEARYPAYAEDYAFFIWGLLELYEAAFETRYLRLARSLNRYFTEHFRDGENGGFFLTDSRSEKLLSRPKEIYDGATPSANAVACYNLIRLARLTHDEALEELAVDTLEAFMRDIAQNPAAHVFSALDILYRLDGGTDVVLAAETDGELAEMQEVLRKKYRPFMTVLRLTGDALKEPENDVYKPIGGKPAAYVCRGFSCAPPVASAEALERLLSS